jgi:hypothetical protein
VDRRQGAQPRMSAAWRARRAGDQPLARRGTRGVPAARVLDKCLVMIGDSRFQ